MVTLDEFDAQAAQRRAQIAQYERALVELKAKYQRLLIEVKAKGVEYERQGRERLAVSVPRRCGHPGTVHLRLASATVNARVASYAEKDCDACVNLRTAEYAREADRLCLPPLEGSSRQVAWANELRLKAIEKHGMDAVSAALSTETNANWWIANNRRLPHLKVFTEVSDALNTEVREEISTLLSGPASR